MSHATPSPDSADLADDRRSSTSFWPETDWDKVLALRDPAAYAEAMAEICQIYHPVFLRVLHRWDPANAEDLAQEFILGLLRNQSLQRADPALGRFRQYVGRMLMNFARKQYSYALRRKRGAGSEHVELTEESAVTKAPDAEIFDRVWARAMLERVVEAFKMENSSPDILRLALRELVCGDAEATNEGYTEFSARTGSSEATLRSEVARTRRRFYERLRQEVALTTVRSEIDEELRYLLRALVAGSGK